jgi:hypothetical protein
MDWSLRKVFPFTMPPSRCVVSGPGPDELDILERRVRWVGGKRFGVILQAEDKSWHIAWFNPAKTPRRGQIPLLIGGSWQCDLNAADTVETLSEEQLRKLGLNEWRAESE